MSTQYAIYFDKPARLGTAPDEIFYNRGFVAILPGNLAKEMVSIGAGKAYDPDDLYEKYHHGISRPEAIFAHVGGGIGDIIQFSALAAFLRDVPLRVFCEKRHIPAVELIDHPNMTIRPIFSVVSKFGKTFSKSEKLCRLSIDHSTVDGGSKNWYDSIFSRIGLNKAPVGYGHPHLKRESAPIEEKTAMICHRSSCQMRTSDFEDFYWPVKEALPGWKIQVLEHDINEMDTAFILQDSTEFVQVIPTRNLGEYFTALDRVQLVITTDTAAIHYREGVGKPALGVFGAFTTESRTKYYHHTHSFNVKSGCKHQPCYVHETYKHQVCPLVKDAMKAAKTDPDFRVTTAPCQTGEKFRKQLFDELVKYKSVL